MRRKLSASFSSLVILLVAYGTAAADHVVFDSFTSQSVSWGKGNFGIFNSSDGSVITGNYIGGSPAFEFIPHNIQSDEVLKQLNVAVGTQETAGVFNFTLTLFTSGNAQEKDPSRWTQLGAWGGQTDGSYNSLSHQLVSVLTTPVALQNDDHYYVMATVDAGQGVDGSGSTPDLAWASTNGYRGYVWEPLLAGYHNAPLQYGSTGPFQVVVGAAPVPEAGTVAGFAAGCLALGVAVVRRRRVAAK